MFEYADAIPLSNVDSELAMMDVFNPYSFLPNLEMSNLDNHDDNDVTLCDRVT